MHLGCPVRYVAAAERFICPCHGGVYDFRGMVAGGPPVRPLDRFYTRVNQTTGLVEIGPRYSVNSELQRFSPRYPGRAARRHRPVPLPGAVRHRRKQAVAAMPKLPAPPLPKVLQPAAQAAGRAERRQASTPVEAGITVVDWLDERTVAVAGHALAAVPQGPAGHQLGLHARLGDAVRVPQPGRDRRVPGHVLPAGRVRRRLRVDPQHQRRRVPRPVRARHAQVGRLGDDHPDLPAHGARVLLRRLQVPARADLDHRRRAADPDAGDGLHRLPAAVRPARPTGPRSSASTSTAAGRSSARSCRTSCAAAPTSAPPRCRASMRSTCC